MGLYGIYTQVSDAELVDIRSLPLSQIEDRVFDLSEGENVPELDIGTAWDGVHFLLTGVSARHARHGDALSEAITGEGRLLGSDVSFVAYTTTERLRAIVGALEQQDVPGLLARRTVEEFRQAAIYPGAHWSTDAIQQLLAQCAEELTTLEAFFRGAVLHEMNIIVEIG
ncbi:hypothetical protein C5B96_06530 [Subtercola sp. Z020]|uniref:DUF1877 family protein n=1 Tax=Subtercola sp. Z020 TaxID=2080582 RepID=UPI000CE8CE0A|nr:DUF1877 family protein [Subtercola sp. Z020]PPF85184.1 hypothetical protein C5B96_06530 [Subtercola sp. Z020]